ncbi:uncharacterized protein CCR75_007824 [Bremia lactucae]|uniref:Uncharacterized protein n=1 Tax=Bremia lactucae TaxID=4779 RepID=A0A976ILW2_BRELC|nr:hypothetical protein CCR75_007824 [Bremia lactucae]
MFMSTLTNWDHMERHHVPMTEFVYKTFFNVYARAQLRSIEKHYKKIRALTEKYGVFSDLIPENPNAVLLAGSRHQLMEKRRVREQVLQYNSKIGKRYLLPSTF